MADKKKKSVTGKKTAVAKKQQTGKKSGQPQRLVSVQSSPKAGAVTIPGEKNMAKQVVQLAQKWGADAIRDSDGTRLDEAFLKTGYQIYSTVCLVRADQKWIREYPQYQVNKYVMSAPVTACQPQINIQLMNSYYSEKYRVNWDADPKQWWEVIDRTTGIVVNPADWDFNKELGSITIKKTEAFHVYTVNFLVYQTWDTTSMYNHQINNWTTPPVISTDPYDDAPRKHLFEFFDNWIKEHPQTDVVRLTTLAYHFTVDSNETGGEKYRDWFGYMDTINVRALQDFEKEYGYKLRPEDFVDEGYYHSTNKVPSRQYLDWMNFVQKFVVKFGKELVDRVHKAGKKAAIFWGDHWIGAEFYSQSFQEMGIDINISACESGVALRRIADTPGTQKREARFYPYIFPDVFNKKGNPLKESQTNWGKIRRAILRKQIDRIGYGGYISLAMKFPKFVDQVAGLCQEFRTILDKSKNTEPYAPPITVAVLDAWGKLRSWNCHTGPEEKFKGVSAANFEVAGPNLLENLAGLPVEVKFISFDDIRNNGIPANVSVIINDGAADTAWSGGSHWKDPAIVTALRKWVNDGGGFIGVTDPSAIDYQGRFFQLSDILGVEKERGISVTSPIMPTKLVLKNFITADLTKSFDSGVDRNYVYPCGKNVQLLAANNDGHVQLAANIYGNGRSVYIAALPYSCDNSRLLMRAIFWAANKENLFYNWFSSNPAVDCAVFPQTGALAVANCTDKKQTTTLYRDPQQSCEISIEPYGIKWFDIEKITWVKRKKTKGF